MKLFGSFLRKHCAWLALYGLTVALVSLIGWLYAVPGEAVWYGLLLCLVFLALGLLAGFPAYRRRHLELSAALGQLELTLDQLPEPWDLVEQDYQALLHTQQRQMSAAMLRRDRRERDMADYYTLWVHQIKTPISAMGLLLQKEDTQLSRELTVQLLRIEQYVEMVLAYVRLGPDSSDYVLRPCDLETAVRKSVRKFAPLFIQSKVRLELEPITQTVTTDEKWLCFALEQLLSNAVKYTPKGTVNVCFRDGRLCVADNGIGIAPEDLPRVCEKGYTGCNGRQDQKASGIGLYLCSQVLNKLGHSLELTSKPGAGTTASIGFDQQERVLE